MIDIYELLSMPPLALSFFMFLPSLYMSFSLCVPTPHLKNLVNLDGFGDNFKNNI